MITVLVTNISLKGLISRFYSYNNLGYPLSPAVSFANPYDVNHAIIMGV